MDGIATEAAITGAKRAPGVSAQARYHNELRRRILEAHPEVQSLIGPDWRTAIFAVLMLALQWTMAWAVSRTNWWIVFLASFTIGQTIYHSVGVLVHENAHRLVFRGTRARFFYDLLNEVTLTSFGAQLVYQHNHVTSHHAHLGEYEGDYEHEDIFRVAARNAYRERHPIRWHLLTALVMIVHLLPLAIITDTIIIPRLLARATGLPPVDRKRDTGATKPSKGELRLFALFSLAVYVGLYFAFGFLAVLYQAWSMSLVLSRWGASIRGQILSEHYGEDGENPTRSTYWWGNWIFYNIGYHVEHHTFSNVPWMKLPKLRSMAPEVFNLGNQHGYYGFWWKQLMSEFTLPRRRSAVFAAELCNERLSHDAPLAPSRTPAQAAA